MELLPVPAKVQPFSPFLGMLKAKLGILKGYSCTESGVHLHWHRMAPGGLELKALNAQGGMRNVQIMPPSLC